MKGIKTPPPSSKSGKKSNSSTPATIIATEDVCSIACAVQPRSDDPTIDRCMVPSSLIKRLGSPKIGNYSLITFPNGGVGLFALWPHGKSKVTADAATFHRIWGPNFDASKDVISPGATKHVQISSKNMSKVRVVACSKFTCFVVDSRNRGEEIKNSASFHSILRGYLDNIHIQSGMRLSITFQGGPVVVVVQHTLSDNGLQQLEYDNNVESTQDISTFIYFFKVNSDTELIIVDEDDELMCGLMTINSSSLSSESDTTTPKRLLTDQPWIMSSIVEKVRESFAGYESEVKSLVELVVSGLILSRNENRPKGVILCGPSGTGKSQLVHSLVTALRCNVKYLDHSLLLRALEGEAEMMLRQCFNDASRIPPCCIIMENMELLLPSRSSSTATFLQKRITSCWLSILDSLPPGVVVLGVTTRVNDLDSAVRRAGRIEREIEIGVPSPSDRYLILSHLLKQTSVDIVLPDTVSLFEANKTQSMSILQSLVEQTAAAAHGTVGADLLTLVKEIFYQNISNNQLSLEDATDKQDSRAPTNHLISDMAVRNALRKISPSALREVVVEVPTVYWTDIGGMHSVKEALQQVVEWPLKHPDWFASLQIGPLKGVLLYGPPGCSKTLMAKAIATESSMNFLAVRGPELLSKWLGESEKAVQALFRRARAAAPAIIFFDEIDALAGARGEMSSGVSDRVLAQLLTELDGIDALKKVVVIAATNRPDMLDPALIRPGRIDRKIYVPPPDGDSRRSILEIELKKMPTTAVVNTVEEIMDDEMIWIDEVIEISDGYSGAEVVALCSEAALLAVEEEAEKLTRKHLMTAASKIKPQITAEMLQFYDNFRLTHR